MIYVPINVNNPTQSTPTINIQKGLTNNFPEILFELYTECPDRDTRGFYEKKYFDLGDEITVYASVTNSYLESVVFTGELRILNPHRGQILCRLNYNDFTETGYNVLTVLCNTGSETVTFQKTIFVESISQSIKDILGKE